jgi:hypothetical protein
MFRVSLCMLSVIEQRERQGVEDNGVGWYNL